MSLDQAQVVQHELVRRHRDRLCRAGDVDHHARRHGESKFGRARFWRGFLDLITVKFLTTYTGRPFHLFGGIGMLTGLVGSGLLGWMLVERIQGHQIGTRPALLTGVLLVVVAIQMLMVGLLAELQRESGGNMAEVLETVVETIRDRFDLRRLIKTLTAQGRLARWILSLLPAFLAVVLTLLNPSYMHPLFATTTGQVFLAIATVMVITGSLVIKRIVNIKV